MRNRSLAVVLAALAALLLVAGCGGGGGGKTAGKTPQQVLALAKQKFDQARSVHVVLETAQQPKGDGILGASGTLTRQPAYDGNADVLFHGIRATVPVTAVGGKVYVKLPMSSKYTAINPADFGIPDPAGFIDPKTGVSTLLTELSGLKRTGQQREGGTILTDYTGTLQSAKVQAIIPSAVEGDYTTEVGVDDGGIARTIQVTGPFFGKGTKVTYLVSLSDYGKAVTIKKP